MWICFNDAFVSAVKAPWPDVDCLLVRARRKAHLTKLFPRMRITHTPQNDYHWRVTVPAKQWADLVAKQIMNIDYDNFKDSVKERKLHDMYALWWNDHHAYQQRS